ncbi:MAG: peptide deformylase [Candidatus Omnitrophota bacterium]|nr:peptide deformylase [Candidatus Omnitrophota bacterium]
MEIVCLPNPCLRKKTSKVLKVSDEEKRMLDEMAKVMYLKGGVGLAACQVGIDKQLAVIDIGDGLIKLINPVVVKKDGCETQEEGCLSVPEAAIKVKRAKKVTVEYLNEGGEAVKITAHGLLARVLQHEIDHLLGKLIIDYLSPIKKLLFSNRLTIRKL